MPEIKEVAVFEVRIPVRYFNATHRLRQINFAYSDLMKKITIMRSWKVKLARMEYEDGKIKSGPPSNETVNGDVAYDSLTPDKKTRS